MEPQVKTPAQQRNSIILNIVIGVLICTATALVYNYFWGRFSKTYSNDAQVQQLVLPINARVGGYIREIRFEEFAEVKKGDTLIIIDPVDFKIQLDLAQAGLEDAKANQEVLSSSVNTLENSQAISSANLQETKARLWNAEQNFKRYERLLAENSVTQQQFDQTKSEYESLKARYESMTKSIDGSKLSTIEARNRLKASEAGIKKAQANVQTAHQNLEYTVITAPCDGIAGRKTINKGQLVQAGQTLIQVIDEKEKWITVNFLEKQSKKLEVGKTVDIKIDALPDKEFKGVIQSIAGATGSVFSLVPTDNATGNFVKVQQRIPVKIAFTKGTPTDKLRAGMNAEVLVK